MQLASVPKLLTCSAVGEKITGYYSKVLVIDSPNSPQIDSEYFDRALEQIRTKLLDKTRRNRLLNFKESARDIAVIDEMPNQVHEHLVLDGASFCFLPLPDLDERENGTEDEPPRELPSANHGLRVERRHRDAKLQTPFRQKELDRRLRRSLPRAPNDH